MTQYEKKARASASGRLLFPPASAPVAITPQERDRWILIYRDMIRDPETGFQATVLDQDRYINAPDYAKDEMYLGALARYKVAARDALLGENEQLRTKVFANTAESNRQLFQQEPTPAAYPDKSLDLLDNLSPEQRRNLLRWGTVAPRRPEPEPDTRNSFKVPVADPSTSQQNSNTSSTTANADSPLDTNQGSSFDVAATSKNKNNPSNQNKTVNVGEVRDYNESGNDSWRAANDKAFTNAANNYNKKYGLKPGDRGYITPEFLKSWAMIESGGDKKAFSTDPFQVNDPRNWAKEKTKIAGLKYRETMTPEKSAVGALEWMRYKSSETDQQGNKRYLGVEEGLKKYNTHEDLHDEPSRMWRLDYHPGLLHKDWYATAILLRENELLRRKNTP